MQQEQNSIELLAKTVAMLSVDAVEKANSGHPGLPMGASLFASVLWSKYLRFNPDQPNWEGRDRFVLSAGHGSMLLYSFLHLFGYKLSLEDLKQFRQWESKTPGHPESHYTDGVEATTGPLGQGLANAVGMALSGKMLSQRYDPKLFGGKVFALVSDGDLMEGISYEASSLAGHLKLSNLIFLYDDNNICLAGPTNVTFTESVSERFKASGWSVQIVDGHDYKAIDQALLTATNEAEKPSIVCFRTTIAQGSPHKQNSSDAHGSPLGKEEVLATKENIGWPINESFYVPAEVKDWCAQKKQEMISEFSTWEADLKEWSENNPQKAKDYQSQRAITISEDLKKELFEALPHQKAEATRSSSGRAIQIIAHHIPRFIGGAADLEPSTKTTIKNGGEIQAPEYAGKNIRFGVREHAMGAIVNGLAYTGLWSPYSATFHVFSDYMRAPIRLAALSHINSLFIFTHDSFWVGEDGPTHEPIEQTQSLRLIPRLKVFRPADGLEVAGSYILALLDTRNPSSLLLSRQDLPMVERINGWDFDAFSKGGYIVSDDSSASVVIAATGSEVHVAQKSASLLEAKGIKARVVSIPCLEIFLAQPKEYRDSIIPKTMKRVSVEAGVTWGWERIVGSDALLIGVDRFGASAPGQVIAEKLGITDHAIADQVEAFCKS